MVLHRVYAPQRMLEACSPGAMLTSFAETGMCIFQDVFLPDLVERATQEMTLYLTDDERRSLLPRYNSRTGVGYLPPEMDGLIRTGGLRTRRAYDYSPRVRGVRDQPGLVLQPLYNRLVLMGEAALGMIGPHLEHPLSDWGGGEHVLKTAIALNENANPEREVFPEHQDFSMLTLFVGGAPPGLQSLLKEKWVDVMLQPHEVLIGAGSFFRKLHPVTVLRHRVMATVPHRLSFSFFLELPGSVVLPAGETAGKAVERVRKLALAV